MSNARNLANIISGGFDIPSAALDNAVPADGSITAAKLASSLDLTGKTLSLPSAAVTPADGSIGLSKLTADAGGLRPQWADIRYTSGNGPTFRATDQYNTRLYVSNGNNGASARGRLHGSAKGSFRIMFQLGYEWGWSEFILYPRDLWEATTGASPSTFEPAGRHMLRIMNNSPSGNNARLGYWWGGSGSTTTWLSSTGTTSIWTAWRDSSNNIRVHDGSSTYLVATSSEEFVVLSGSQSPHYTSIIEAGSYKS